jgi:hypothetical protein
MTTLKMSQMLSVPLSRVRSPKLKRQTPVEDEIDGQQQPQPPKSIASDYESNSSRSLSPYWRIVMDPESSSSYLDVPETTNNSRRSSNNSVVRFTPHDASDLCSILDMTVNILIMKLFIKIIFFFFSFSTNQKILKKQLLIMINILYVVLLIFIKINLIY